VIQTNLQSDLVSLLLTRAEELKKLGFGYDASPSSVSSDC